MRSFNTWFKYVTRRKVLHTAEKRLQQKCVTKLMEEAFLDMVEIVQVGFPVNVCICVCVCMQQKCVTKLLEEAFLDMVGEFSCVCMCVCIHA